MSGEDKPRLKFVCSRHGEQPGDMLTTLALRLDCGCVFVPSGGAFIFDRNEREVHVDWDLAVAKRAAQRRELRTPAPSGVVVVRETVAAPATAVVPPAQGARPVPRAPPLCDDDPMPIGKYGPRGEKLLMKDVPASSLLWMLAQDYIVKYPRLHSYIVVNEDRLKQRVRDGED